MYVVILILHILVAFALMAVVLMQSGRGRGLSGTFGGGGGNQTLFGGRGAVDFLGKATWFLGAGFMLTSLILAVLAGSRSGSQGVESLIPKEAPMSAPTLPPGAPPTALPGEGEAPVPSGTEGTTPEAPGSGESQTPVPEGGGN